MAATTVARDQLRKGAKVVATTELRGVPEGTPGRVMMVAGLSWIRYWVRFDNGVQLGSISRDKLATKADLERGDEVEELEVAGDAGGAAADAGEGDGGGGKATPSGTLVPQKLLDRSAAARVRLGAA
ncbi:MAG: hypothetical protein KDB04_13085 [Acidimicrobiales bacterium]|nr:hypothetical protein [Acidimicrobiales bacterium]HRW38164.1 hypothetical protein [Aquihabitans sp.]